ncbi:hypothetical protein K402DRAFT_388211 [Aulographum hederae CBS 113979]|uniref:DUF6593 domain-containing protein n=1 Tax=Aulographum hederae CBS 113979 TaxID=1176131 RepID=A0A6G1HH51_9PEZI|nr:hypothetical protein K402DRAFT_388211 [Aulographum hederae CBS 113979]
MTICNILFSHKKSSSSSSSQTPTTTMPIFSSKKDKEANDPYNFADSDSDSSPPPAYNASQQDTRPDYLVAPPTSGALTTTDHWGPSTLFHLYRVSGTFSRHTKYALTLPDKKGIYMHVNYPATCYNPFSHKPHMIFQKPLSADLPPDDKANQETVASVVMHSFHDDDIEFPSGRRAPTKLISEGMLTRRHRVRLEGREYYWKGTGHHEGLKCVDIETDEEVARYQPALAAKRKIGKIQVQTGGMSEALLEGIVVSGLVMAQKEATARQASANSAAASSAGAAAAASG